MQNLSKYCSPPPKICFFVKTWSIFLAVFGPVFHFLRRYTYQYLDTEFVFVCNFCGYTYKYLDKFCTFYVNILSSIWHEFLFCCDFLVDIPISIWTRFLLSTSISLAVFGHGICFCVQFLWIYLSVFGQVLHFLRRYT